MSYHNKLKEIFLKENNNFFDKKATSLPYNINGGKFFSGINAISLMLQKTSPSFVTWMTLSNLKGSINKGASAVKLEYWDKNEESFVLKNFNVFAVEDTNLQFSPPIQEDNKGKIESFFQEEEATKQNIRNIVRKEFLSQAKENESGILFDYFINTVAFILEAKFAAFGFDVKNNISSTANIIKDYSFDAIKGVIARANNYAKDLSYALDLPMKKNINSFGLEKSKVSFRPQVVDPNKAIGQFLSLADSLGVNLKDINLKADGCKHRAPLKGETKGKTSASYKLSLNDIPYGFIKNYKTGDYKSYYYYFKDAVEYSKYNVNIEKANQKSQDEYVKELENKRFETKQKITGIISSLKKEDQSFQLKNNQYLIEKKIKPYNVYVDKYNQNLLIPVVNVAGEIISMQRIYPNPEKPGSFTKIFEKNSLLRGGFHALTENGYLSNAKEDIYIAEGYSTAASIKEKFPSKTVISVFSSNNYEHVINAIDNQYNNKTFVIFADNDRALSQKTDFNGSKYTNVGKEKAEEQALKDNVQMILTPYINDDITDFNDLKNYNSDLFNTYLDESVRSLKENPSIDKVTTNER